MSSQISEEEKHALEEVIQRNVLEREKLFVRSLPIFEGFDRENRNFFIVSAQISAAVGAFSFLLFDKANCPNSLLTGNVILAVNVVFSFWVNFFILRKASVDFSNTYNEQFERLSVDIENTKNFLEEKISKDEYVDYLNREVEKISENKKESSIGFWPHLVVTVLFSVAMVYIVFSLI